MSKKQRVIEIKEDKDIRHYIALIAILLSVTLTFSVYQICEARLLYSIRDLGLSFLYYVLFIFNKHEFITCTVNLPVDIDIGNYLGVDFAEIRAKLDVFWEQFFDLANFAGYLGKLLDVVNIICIVATSVGPALIIVFYVYFSRYSSEHVEESDKDNTRLKQLLRFLTLCCRKVSDTYHWLYEYYKAHKVYPIIFVLIWLINTNLMTVFVEFIAYYFYFVVSFDFASIGIQLVKLFYDFIIMLWTLPLPLWAVIAYIIFDLVRKSAALDKLRHMEAKNRGFDNEQPICIMAIGAQGVGKTKTTVDMTLSFQNEFRDKALEQMDNNMARFPSFDFPALERDLRARIMEREIINLASARRYVRSLKYEYGRHPAPAQLWGYDVGKHPRSYNNGLTLVSIWTVIENYAQEYFIYTMNVSLIISNLAIRSDVDIIDKGYFVHFNMDFFKRDPAKLDEHSAYAHIIDFDLFRIGCQMIKENAIAGSFEFGVINVTEIGKERGNTQEIKELKKNSDEANQKNDLFNQWLKMIRHGGTVEGYCYVRFICDEQRASSWGADARDLVALLDIRSISALKMSLRFCILPAFFMNTLFPKYNKWYNNVKLWGNENCFVISVLHRFMGRMFGICERKFNFYGYYTEIIATRPGNLEEDVVPVEHKYYIMPKKIYSNRYSTDCFKDAFAVRALEAGTSLYYIPTYESACATLDELKKQNSYMANTFIAMYINPEILKVRKK